MAPIAPAETITVVLPSLAIWTGQIPQLLGFAFPFSFVSFISSDNLVAVDFLGNINQRVFPKSIPYVLYTVIVLCCAVLSGIAALSWLCWSLSMNEAANGLPLRSHSNFSLSASTITTIV
jgi:hypothetical protein